MKYLQPAQDSMERRVIRIILDQVDKGISGTVYRKVDEEVWEPVRIQLQDLISEDVQGLIFEEIR